MDTSNLVKVSEKDYLDQDPKIRGQNYVCLSFVSPEDVIQKKEVYFFQKYLESFSGELKGTFDALAERFRDDATVLDMLAGVRNANEHLFDGSKINTSYEHFLITKRDELEGDYHAANDFQTSIRGIKVRGSYERIEEAKARAQAIQKFDKVHHIFVAQVGCWCPWSPKAGEIEDQEYSEAALNTLVKGHRENMGQAFDHLVVEASV